MHKKFLADNFILIKCILVLFIIVYILLSQNRSITDNCIIFLGCSSFLGLSISCEFKSKYKLSLIILSGIAISILYYKFGTIIILLCPIVILDIVTYFTNRLIIYLIPYIIPAFINCNLTIYFIFSTFLIIIYYQNYIVINTYMKMIKDNEAAEQKLKNNIDENNLRYKLALSKSRLESDNKILENKNFLSQTLHDKLGHNINGSLYQLEASKILMDTNPDKAKNIIQNVIDALRIGMDEIRAILRDEKPDKKRTALLQLNSLCNDCKDKYNIDAELIIENDLSKISEPIWDIILDNSFEGITNALKYSHCTKIKIQITVLNKIVRCFIEDNGIGCTCLVDGMGLEGMRKRIRAINGFLDFDTINGFKINMLLPLEGENRLMKEE